MNHKLYYLSLSVLCILAYNYYGNSDTSSVSQSTGKETVIQEHVSFDDEGGIITPAAKKFTIKKAKKKRKVYQTKTMKLYEKEDSDAFIARIEEEIEASQYETAYHDNLLETFDESNEDIHEKRDALIAMHEHMMLVFNTVDTTSMTHDSYVEETEIVDDDAYHIMPYDVNY